MTVADLLGLTALIGYGGMLIALIYGVFVSVRRGR